MLIRTQETLAIIIYVFVCLLSVFPARMKCYRRRDWAWLSQHSAWGVISAQGMNE